MSAGPFKVDALVTALDTRRRAEGISWRELGRQAGISAATLTRLRQGKPPDANTFRLLVTWLGMPPEHFMEGGEVSKDWFKASPPVLQAALSPLLRDNEITTETADALADLVRAVYRLFKVLDAAGLTRRRNRARRKTVA